MDRISPVGVKSSSTCKGIDYFKELLNYFPHGKPGEVLFRLTPFLINVHYFGKVKRMKRFGNLSKEI